MTEQWTEEMERKAESLSRIGLDMSPGDSMWAAALAELARLRAHHEASYRQAIKDIDRVLKQVRVLREALVEITSLESAAGYYGRPPASVVIGVAQAALLSSEEPKKEDNKS